MDNPLIRQFFRNVFYASGAQILILLIGILRALILPAFLSVDSYGYWSIYVFYSTYVGLFCFGYNDGLYLRYGDYDYKELPFIKIRSASRLFSFILAFITITAFAVVSFLVDDKNERFAMQMASANIFILGLNAVTLYVLQVTNRFKIFGIFSCFDKVMVLLSVLLLFFLKEDNWRLLVCIDLFAKIIVLLVLVIITREIWLGRCLRIRDAFHEFWDNSSVGLKLMIANIMGMLLIGLGRIYIQFAFDIDIYSIYSFGISLTGIIITAITSFSLVLYPTLKRLPVENMPKYFNYVNTFTRLFGGLAIICYFPITIFIPLFYSKYSDVLSYLNILFAISFLQSKIAILNNTYYKLMRLENDMLFANISTIIVFAVLMALGYIINKNVIIIPICTFIAFALRCYMSEYFLERKLKSAFNFSSFIEILFLIGFVLISYFIKNMWISMSVVFLTYLFLVISDRRNTFQLVSLIRRNR